MKRIASAVLLLTVVACGRSDEAPAPSVETEDTAPDPAGTVEVLTRALSFEAPSEIPSGWTTFRFRNESPMTHFVLVERMPEGQGLVSQQELVAPVFQEGFDLLTAGEAEEALERFGELPSWFAEVVFLGGPGLTAPGSTSEATVYLEPGTYLLECYVKTGGVFHSYNPDPAVYGMVHEFTVTGEASGAPEPEPTLRIGISSAEGIEWDADPTAGPQTVAVLFTDQTVHENFVGHDVHLVRLAADTDLDTLEEWMDWTQPLGLQTPAPARFVGGINEMPAGTTGYFDVVLEPGTYAWVSEVPGAAGKGMLKTFTVQ